MKTNLKQISLFMFMIIVLLAGKVDVKAEVVRNTSGETTPSGYNYDYKYWTGTSWQYNSSKSYTNYPIDITYNVTYCYEEAYKMIDLVNAERRKAGVPELQAKDELMEVAMKRAAETAVYWSHTRPDGSSWSSASMYCDGENLHVGESSAKEANASLVDSKGHYETMVNSRYFYAGYGCVEVHNTRYWVQVFSGSNKYHENRYDYFYPENNIPVDWNNMSCGDRKDYPAKFTAKVNPNFITVKSRNEELRVGKETKDRIYIYMKEWSYIDLTSDQYNVKVLTPNLISYQKGTIKALKAGTAKIQYTLKADSSLTTTLEIKIKDNPVKKGSKVRVGSNTYKVTSTSNKTVCFYTEKKNVKKVSIPKTVKISGKTYKVTTIVANACKNNKKLSSVTIGANVKTIGKNAFYGCKNLKKITVKSTRISSVGKNALKGIHKKAVVRVPKNKYTKYKKLFCGKGQKKSVKIKK